MITRRSLLTTAATLPVASCPTFGQEGDGPLATVLKSYRAAEDYANHGPGVYDGNRDVACDRAWAILESVVGVPCETRADALAALDFLSEICREYLGSDWYDDNNPPARTMIEALTEYVKRS